MREQGFNPYLPSYEYVPDGEPRVFGNRVYIYGSHDRFNGYAYCLNDYVCYSASVTDLKNWRYEGVIYKRGQDPKNAHGDMCLYAPDVIQGADKRYYLYYALSALPIISVAVCDTPAGAYEFLGYVRHKDDVILGLGDGDPPMFDPGVLAEDGKIYLYTGFCAPDDKTRPGASVTILEPDMLTVARAPRAIVPGKAKGRGTSFEGHEFFEASSVRKVGDMYYFIYSSVLYHELCYATSKKPDEGFVFGGTIISNSDMFIGSYKEPDFAAFYGGNNHGSIAFINGAWFVFYHRHTNGTNYSRQACLEPIEINKNGKISQAEMTSNGPNLAPLKGFGEYPAYIACNLFCEAPCAYTAPPGDWMDCRFPKITQDGKDGDETEGYIANMREGAVCGFKYFNCHNVKKIAATVRGGGYGASFDIFNDFRLAPVGRVPLGGSNEWKTYEADVVVPDGVCALYFKYRGRGAVSFLSFSLS